MPLLHNGKYRIQDSLDLIYDLGIPESADMVALAFEIGRALSIITSWRLFRMLAAVELDDETDLMTGEIGEVAPDRNLPPKMRALNRNAPQLFPELGFRIGRIGAQTPAVGDFEAVELGGLLGHRISVLLRQRS